MDILRVFEGADPWDVAEAGTVSLDGGVLAASPRPGSGQGGRLLAAVAEIDRRATLPLRLERPVPGEEDSRVHSTREVGRHDPSYLDAVGAVLLTRHGLRSERVAPEREPG